MRVYGTSNEDIKTVIRYLITWQGRSGGKMVKWFTTPLLVKIIFLSDFAALVEAKIGARVRCWLELLFESVSLKQKTNH